MTNNTTLSEIRCKFCHKLLAKVVDPDKLKEVEIKCGKCKTINTF